MISVEEPKPFVKWAGGKRQLLDVLVKESPEQFNDYYEPFLGGGALYFKLWSLGRIKKAYLNDSNAELVNVYSIIQKRVGELIEELSHGKYENSVKIFYEIRGRVPEDRIEQAARFIYLNKTAYNGLYRVNSKGGFNVPFGKYANTKILDEDNLQLVSEALRKAKISCTDFEKAVSSAGKGDYAYFDPPYYPLSKTASFTKYTHNDFTLSDQERLRDVCSALNTKGIYTIVSNSDTDVVRTLYQGYNVVEVSASRQINCKAEKRGKITELMIKVGEFDEIPGVWVREPRAIQRGLLHEVNAIKQH